MAVGHDDGARVLVDHAEGLARRAEVLLKRKQIFRAIGKSLVYAQQINEIAIFAGVLLRLFRIALFLAKISINAARLAQRLKVLRGFVIQLARTTLAVFNFRQILESFFLKLPYVYIPAFALHVAVAAAARLHNARDACQAAHARPDRAGSGGKDHPGISAGINRRSPFNTARRAA